MISNTAHRHTTEPPTHGPAQTASPRLECPSCSYDLSGHDGDPLRCPECGHEMPRTTAALPTHHGATRRKLESIETWMLRGILIALLLAGLYTMLIIGAPLRTLWLAIPAVAVYLLLRRGGVR